MQVKWKGKEKQQGAQAAGGRPRSSAQMKLQKQSCDR